MAALTPAALAAVHRFADVNSARINAAADVGRVITTVASVTAGGARDGNAKVTVTWRGASCVVSGYAASYTPVVGHRVVCDFIDNQLIIAYRIIGQP